MRGIKSGRYKRIKQTRPQIMNTTSKNPKSAGLTRIREKGQRTSLLHIKGALINLRLNLVRMVPVIECRFIEKWGDIYP